MNGWIVAGPVLGASFSGWLLTARVIFTRMMRGTIQPDAEDMIINGIAAIFFGLFWPVIVVGIGPWIFVTAGARREHRKRTSAARTAALEYEIYGRRPLS